MTERIYTRDQHGRLEPLEEERFAKEDELQAGLIAEHPEVLDGDAHRCGRAIPCVGFSLPESKESPNHRPMRRLDGRLTI